MTGNHVKGKLFRGFESLSLRHLYQRALLLACAAVFGLGAVHAQAPEKKAAIATTTAEDAVFMAVLRQQIKDWSGSIICLGIDPGAAPQSPSKDFMARFGSDARIRTLTECEPRAQGAIDGVSRRPAVILTAGPIDWVAADEAHVTLTYFRSRQRSALRTYRVVKEPGGWISLGPILKDAPTF
jgi:hypothetical protein